MIPVGGDLAEIDLVQTMRVLAEKTTPHIGNDVSASSRPGEGASTCKRGHRPSHAIPETRLSRLENLVALSMGQADVLGDLVLNVACLGTLTAPEHLQHRQQEAVPGRHLGHCPLAVGHGREANRTMSGAPRDVSTLATESGVTPIGFR